MASRDIDTRSLPVLGDAARPAGRCAGGAGACGCDSPADRATDDRVPHPPEFWRSLEEHARGGPSPSPEFPEGSTSPPSGWSRRDFVKLLGASAALAGIQACESPRGQILPYVNRPPEVVPGTPLEYATTMTLDGYGVGVLAQAREGRPVKIEGNPEHPASLGAAGVFEQASILQLYDTHRGRRIRQRDRARSWDYVLRLLGQSGEGSLPWPDGGRAPGAEGGRGLRFLLPPTASPFRIHWIREVQRRFPAARFTFHAPLHSAVEAEGAKLAFGRALVPLYDFRTADVVVSLDADFLDQGPVRLRYAHDFAEARRIRSPSDRMNRLYSASPLLDPTASIADHHVPARASEIEMLAAWLARAVDDPGLDASALREPLAAWLRYAARDLRGARGRSVIVAGPGMPAEAHALAYLANARLGNIGRTLSFIEPQLHEGGGAPEDLTRLVEEMQAGLVETLVIMETNPVYSAPADLPFDEALSSVPRTLCLSLFENETAEKCEWYIPAAHYLESWGDARAYDGTLSTVQPLIAPLFLGRSTDELLMAFAGEAARPPHEALQALWRDRLAGAGDADTLWKEVLQAGVVGDTAAARLSPTPASGVRPFVESIQERQRVRQRAVEVAAAAAAGPAGQAEKPARGPRERKGRREDGRLGKVVGVVEVAIRQDPRVHDGRFADTSWLLELPDPVTKLTWENAALIAPATAERMGLETGDVVRLEADGRTLDIPALVDPGHARDAVTLRLGYGRAGAEGTAFGRGVSAYRFRTTRAPSLVAAATLRPILETSGPDRRRGTRNVKLASAQTHWSMEGRPIVLQHTLDEYRRDPEFTEKHKGPVPTLYEGPPMTSPQQWAMTVDLALCTGCSACVVACYAENNLPVVGKQGVLDAREMSWLRVDRYLTGDPDRPGVVHQPMLCQHCEKAPCEYVCPVNATVHSDDGLNGMIYNRCVGTRFCNNNCAWKVRRFNWFDYNRDRPQSETLVLNPDVTVRERGVMEKCTYCVQRIRRAERRAQIEERPLRSDEVVTACQQACPTNAIVFGSMTDPGSAVSKTREQSRIYSVLHELGTKPRTQYLARITNPDAELRAEERAAARRGPHPAEEESPPERPGALSPREEGAE